MYPHIALPCATPAAVVVLFRKNLRKIYKKRRVYIYIYNIIISYYYIAAAILVCVSFLLNAMFFIYNFTHIAVLYTSAQKHSFHLNANYIGINYMMYRSTELCQSFDIFYAYSNIRIQIINIQTTNITNKNDEIYNMLYIYIIERESKQTVMERVRERHCTQSENG